MNILSTKILSKEQEKMLLQYEIIFQQYNAIEIAYLDYTTPREIEYALFTSQNGVQGFLNGIKRQSCTIKNSFCVGKKTERLLTQNGQKIIKSSSNSEVLGNFIAKNYKNESFYYFCGNKRREELPNILKTNKIPFFEVKTYKTELKPQQFDQNWDIILFFSPSGVESYKLHNPSNLTTAFCIGNTTAQEAKKYFKNIKIAKTTSVKSVVELAVDYINLKKENIN